VSVNEIRYCTARNCKRNGNPTQVDADRRLCGKCQEDLASWLKDIPTVYALLPAVLEPGTVDRNPDARTTRSSFAAAPMRLDVIDLLDTRRGIHAGAVQPTKSQDFTDARRGALGTLSDLSAEVAELRDITPPASDISSNCTFLKRHLEWISRHEIAGHVHTEVKALNRTLCDAIGDYRPHPVGRCNLTPDDQEKPCDGPLLANRYGGVRCSRCSATWDARELRLLGLSLAQDATG
jgi:hypothetical protein